MIMKVNLIFVLLILMVLTGCSEKVDVDYKKGKEMENIKLETLKDKKIYFGHQSVGYNIIKGIEDIMANSNQPGEINIQELKSINELEKPGIYHAANGENGSPKSKVDAFKDTLEKGLGEKADVAFFKFCYVDFDKYSNVQEIFDYYVKGMGDIKEKFPELKIVHVTTPLSVHGGGSGIKSFIKNLLEGDLCNVKRNQFNELLINKYGKDETIYDLAKVESLYPDGRRSTFNHKGKKYFSLAKEYTHDGGHLNENGRYYAAKELILTLSRLTGN